MKSRDLQPRLLHPAKLSFRIKTDKELPRQEKTKGVHRHQTISIWNVKGTSFKKKIKAMHNKMVKKTRIYQLNLKNKLRTETESWIQRAFWWLPDGSGYGGIGEEVRGLSMSSYRIAMGPWLVWLSGWVPACKSRGHWFDSQSRAHACVSGQVSSGGRMAGNHTLMVLSLSFSLPSPL